jgi:S1-C subfamily serine protease
MKRKTKAKKYEAKIIGSDPRTDIALLKINVKHKLPYAHLGDSKVLEKGDWVIAFGNPFGLDHSVSMGIVSAKSREISSNENRRFDDFIQTDAAINFGNSGGPLVNLKGEVIGINTAITAQGSGIGFAVPINMAKDIVLQLKSHGAVSRGYLGVMIQDVTEEMKEALGLRMAQGVLVNDILPDGPAAKGDIRRGDVIVSVDGKSVDDMKSLQKLVANIRPDKITVIEVIREKKKKRVKLKLGSLEKENKQASIKGDTEQKPDRLGLTVSASKKTSGVEVTNVKENSAADLADIMPGDIIHKVNSREIRTTADYNNAVKGLRSKTTVLFDLQRMGAQGRKMKLFLAFRVP